MNINLNITATELSVAIDNLASAILGMGNNSVGAVEQAQPAPRKPRATKQTDAVPAETVQEEIKTADPAPVEKVATEVIQADDTTKVEEKAEITIVEVRAKMAPLNTPVNGPKIKAFLNQYGAAKLTEFPAEHYPELMAFAEELG